MDPNMLFENFDLLMDSPNSTAKMRELVLQLAVQGKLVEQDPDDEPARELLKRIKAEKEKLIAEGKIKKQKPLAPINEDEFHYDLPQKWEWVRFGVAFDVTSSKRIHVRDYVPKGVSFFRAKEIGELRNGKPITTNIFISYEKFEELRLLPGFPNVGDLMLTSVGSIGNSWICDGRDFYYKDGNITKVGSHQYADMRYMQCFIDSPLFNFQVTNAVSGTAYNALPIVKLNNLFFPLPPLAEQKRIVAKVDQLMELCDQLDACQKKASTKYESLNDVALEKLLSSKTIDEFANHWQFIRNNFDLIYNDPAHVNKLRQAILQLAVQGKLAPQDLNDEPASELLKRIKAEKEKLITEGKIKKQKLLPPITEDKIPYELPNGWEWVRLGELGEINPRINVDNDEIDVSFIPMKMISEKYGTLHSFDRRKWAEVKKGFTYFMDNDVGLAKITPCFENGKSTVFKGLLNGVGAGTTELHIFRQDPELILPEYVLIFFKCPRFLKDAKEKMTGTAGQKRVPRDFVRFVPFPLPSISEQKHIVSKVDQLMHLCDELQTRLSQSKNNSEMLMQAVLQETFDS